MQRYAAALVKAQITKLVVCAVFMQIVPLSLDTEEEVLAHTEEKCDMLPGGEAVIEVLCNQIRMIIGKSARYSKIGKLGRVDHPLEVRKESSQFQNLFDLECRGFIDGEIQNTMALRGVSLQNTPLDIVQSYG